MMKIKFVAVNLLGVVVSASLPAFAAAAAVTDPASIVSRYGTVVSSQPVGVGGLTAWTVKKGGRSVVLYTTADGQALFSGVVWEAKTGRNLSDKFISQPIKPLEAGSATEPPKAVAAFDGKFTATIPESMKTVDTLAGVKEGSGGIADTLYIVVDPRCPYCRKAYNSTRQYVEKGFTIKWIPAVALGDSANGIPLAATLLQSDDKAAIERVMGKHEPIKVKPTKETEESLRNNLAFMYAAFEQNGNQQPGVPVAFFIDRRTGKPRMMTGVSETVVLEDILGKL